MLIKWRPSSIIDVEYKDRLELKVDDLTTAQVNYLADINRELTDLEFILKKEALKLQKTGDARVSSLNDWVEDYELEYEIIFQLREDDPAYEEEKDNIIAVLNGMLTRCDCDDFDIWDSTNHNEFQYSSTHPMKDEHHCWLYHDLTAHTRLGWVNVLRIGMIWVDVNVQYQKFIKLDKKII